MSSIRPPVGVATGQFDPTQLTDYEELTSATAGFAVAVVVVYPVGRLLLIPGMMRLVSARNRNNPTLQPATETYAHVVVIGAFTNGLFLVVDPDFNVDNWVSWPGGEGIVEAIDFRVTRMWTMNNKAISVSNTELMTNALTRSYDQERYWFTEHADITYAGDAELTLRGLVETTQGDDHMLDDPEPAACIVESAGSSAGLQTEFWAGSPMGASLADIRLQYRWRAKWWFDEEGLTLGSVSGREVSGCLDMDLVGGRDGG